MDNRQFVQRLADKTGLQHRDITAAIESLADAIASHCAALDSVAIPGFGTFAADKADEYVTVDPLTMKRSLVPPEIRSTFRPSVILRNRISRK